MVFCYAKAYHGVPPIREIELAVRRNFSGLEEIDPWKIFEEHLLGNTNVSEVIFLSFS